MVQGILFDKDGTLIDFFELWLGAAKEVIPEFIRINGIPDTGDMEDYLLQTIGVRGNRVDPDGALAYKSYCKIAEDISNALSEKKIFISGQQIEKQLMRMFDKYVQRKDAALRPLADLKSLFEELKSMGVFIGLATADTIASAKNCLRMLEVEQYFDYIGADDGRLRPKPEPDMLVEFTETMGIPASQVAVVGDTYSDILFARKCNSIAVGVLSGVSRYEDFGGEADYILESIAQTGDLCREISKEEM